ncbi:MAG: hypothetical protein M3R08_00885 [Bacteroidota bacterium]|nr:hypothetical protein [Bacteroidota bacterium]
MAAFEFRPRTRFSLPGDPAKLVERVVMQTRRNNPARLQVASTGEKVVVRFPKEIAQVWTPQLELNMHARSEGGVVKAIVGPSSSIWMLFRTALILAALSGIIGLALSFVQWSTRDKPWGIYLAAAGLVAGLFIWFLSEEGKRRAKDEMDLLRTFMNDAWQTDQFLDQGKRTCAPDATAYGLVETLWTDEFFVL